MVLRSFRFSFVVLLALASTALVASDGRIEINQVNALAGGVTPGDTPGFPVTISVGGSYVLTSDLDLTVVGANANDTTAIDASQSDPAPVSIDLNGFTIRGPTDCEATVPCTNTGAGSGIYYGRTSVSNGAIVGMGFVGIISLGGTIDSVHIRDSGSFGIDINTGTIRNSSFTQNGGYGVAMASSTIENSIIYNNLGGGVFINDGLVRGCFIKANLNGPELEASGTALLDSLIFTDQTSGEFNCNVGAGCSFGGNRFVGCEGADCYTSGSTYYQTPAGSNYCGSVLCPGPVL